MRALHVPGPQRRQALAAGLAALAAGKANGKLVVDVEA
jgi:hypothetical protein